LGPEGYLNHIQQAKRAVSVPIIASLNGSTVGGWTQYAKQIEQAGADALECNIYSIPTDPDLTSTAVEQQYLDILKAVKSAITIPVAVKISPFFSNMSNMAMVVPPSMRTTSGGCSRCSSTWSTMRSSLPTTARSC
jgi:dihydroorotate dehydrogenase (fumarate)